MALRRAVEQGRQRPCRADREGRFPQGIGRRAAGPAGSPARWLVGFDLCPRLAGLKKRRLYLPKGLEIPQILQPIVAETVSRRAIGRGWEGLLRLSASVKHGWDSATAALDRFGSAAAGNPVYNAG